jgi:hypothetical protein
MDQMLLQECEYYIKKEEIQAVVRLLCTGITTEGDGNDSVQFEQWFNDSDKGYINYTLASRK